MKKKIANEKNIFKKKFKKYYNFTCSFYSYFIAVFLLFFNDYKNSAFLNSQNDYELNIDKFTSLFEKRALLYDKPYIENIFQSAVSTDFIKAVKVDFKKYLFNKDTLVFNTQNFDNYSYNLADVTVDAKFGEVNEIQNSSLFEFVASDSFNLDEELIFKYQLFKDNIIMNFVIPLKFGYHSFEKLEQDKEDFNSLFELVYDINFDKKVTKELFINDINYATLEFVLDDLALKKDVYSYFSKLFFISLAILFPLAIFLFFYNKYLDKKYIVKPIKHLDEVVSNLIENRFSVIDNKMFEDSIEYKNLLENITKLSNKVASLVNDLNINKETMEKNLLTDSLTGLYDKKMLDIDIKSMFVTSASGYLFLVKIAKLNQIENLNGKLKTDDFILSYVNIIKNIISFDTENNLTFYRFQGSEFMILAKNYTYEQSVNLAKQIIENLESGILKNYSLPENIFHIGAAPIDKYGTTDSIIEQVYEEYSIAYDKNVNGFAVLKESKTVEEIKRSEELVTNIINNKDFDISFVFDTYSFVDDKLLMRELKPVLKYENGDIFPIGAFVAISENINLNFEFDSQVIEKAIDFISKNSIDYKLAVNLSIKTIANDKFIDFLENLVKKYKLEFENIVFSITSYSALIYKKVFLNFVKNLNRLGIEILIKRYKTKDFSLDELSSVKINYIKIDKDLTQNVSNDLVKKHKIRNIVIFAEINDTKVLIENIESTQDFEYLRKLDLYGINK